MRQKCALLVTLTAWLFATGSHWDLVQTFAWGKMFAAYAQTMSYADAARMTFTADNLCGVCEIVVTAQQADDDQPAPIAAGAEKIMLSVFDARHLVLKPVEKEVGSVYQLTVLTKYQTAPPVPPPRA
ncbi:hypothetical protein [Synoicihabitans lomoniglobus]|uniref:Uncharacterized protein n=1 Tax=Synoicihabitans lomoniglobus TaxID=2909285 RepID=A0AAE9ZTP4_9BACT|nr:hypothetical protein [Opitutaceae bacterium LMO-M01]WED64980.1 hypothetical protein PXH66_21745 [Opitutaceae bacterium LMO-M01]